ncbi:hypothetical protein C8J56DRAFT_884349 [Mycena floridula]|nr:hypothetical protein C8J56DRAFT_884349 [Mycena floridula]
MSSSALINLDPSLPETAFRLAFPHPEFCHRLRFGISNLPLTRSLTDNDIEAVVCSGLDPVSANYIGRVFFRLTHAAATNYGGHSVRWPDGISAGNDHKFRNLPTGDPTKLFEAFPKSIPRDVYNIEWPSVEDSPPHITFAIIENLFYRVEVADVSELCELIYHSIMSSIRKGFRSELNYGPVFGMTRKEFWTKLRWEFLMKHETSRRDRLARRDGLGLFYLKQFQARVRSSISPAQWAIDLPTPYDPTSPEYRQYLGYPESKPFVEAKDEIFVTGEDPSKLFENMSLFDNLKLGN